VARWLTALLVLAPALGRAAPGAALHVSATVVRSMIVSPDEAERRARIATGSSESPRAPSPRPSPPAGAGGEGGAKAGADGGDATCVVVTIHADGEPYR
jgi:hypothetical protein